MEAKKTCAVLQEGSYGVPGFGGSKQLGCTRARRLEVSRWLDVFIPTASARFSRALQLRLNKTIFSMTAFLRQEVFCSNCCKLLQFLEQRCDALMTVCFWSTNVIMVWAWMLSSPCALGTRTAVWLEHGCSHNCMLLEH